MTPRWLVLCDEDFARSIEISRVSDLYDSEGSALAEAEDAIKGGSRMCYVFKLSAVYVPENGRLVEVRQVELTASKQVDYSFGGTE